jgi:hypothetical protein
MVPPFEATGWCFLVMHFPMELLRTGSTLRFGCVQGKQLAEDTKYSRKGISPCGFPNYH